MTAVTNKTNSKKAWFTVSLLAIIFIGPLLLAWWIFILRPTWLQQTTNKGTLIQPPSQFLNLPLYTQTGSPTQLPQATLQQWLLVYVSNLPCKEICQQNLFKLRQVKRSFLARDKQRLQQIWLSYAAITNPKLRQVLRTKFTMLQHYVITRNHLKLLLPKAFTAQSSVIFIVDPKQNIVLAYPSKITYKALLSDVRKLLKVSKIG